MKKNLLIIVFCITEILLIIGNVYEVWGSDGFILLQFIFFELLVFPFFFSRGLFPFIFGKYIQNIHLAAFISGILSNILPISAYFLRISYEYFIAGERNQFLQAHNMSTTDIPLLLLGISSYVGIYILSVVVCGCIGYISVMARKKYRAKVGKTE